MGKLVILAGTLIVMVVAFLSDGSAQLLVPMSMMLGVIWLTVAMAGSKPPSIPTTREAQEERGPAPVHPSRPPVESDPFFGRLAMTEHGEPCLGLRDVCALASDRPDEDFAAQLNRLLRSTPKRSVVLLDDTSAPPFARLLAAITPERIKRIQIQARRDVNPNVEATLECSLSLANGVVYVRTNWCAWKPARADEIISSLLVPLVALRLLPRVWVATKLRQTERIAMDYRGIVGQILHLSGYPHVDHAAGDDNLTRYVRQLEEAGQRSMSVA